MTLTVESQIPCLPGEISLCFLSGLKLSIQFCRGRDRRRCGTNDAVSLMLKTELGYRGRGPVFYCFPVALGFDATVLKNQD
jgi:hypothetical protein